MSDTRVAERYARALYEKASELGNLEEVAGNITSLNEVVKQNREFNQFLNSPLISKDVKKATLQKIFKGFNPSATHMFELMADKNRESVIGSMGAEFARIYNKNHSITEAVVTSASDLDNNSLSQIEQYIKAKTGAKTVQLRTKTDPSLVGGMMIMFEGKIYDSSISSQLKKIKTELNIA